MNELRSAVDAVLVEDPATLTGPELGGRLVALEREIARLMAAQAAALAVFDARGDYADDGAATAGAWLRHHCRLTPGDANSRVRVSRRLRDQLDATRDALAAGSVTYAQVRVIAEQAGRVADRLGDDGAVALKTAEPFFLEAAAKLHPNDLGKVVRRWEQVIDHDGFLTDSDRQFERRFFNLSQGFDGMWRVDGVLDAESGATLHAALQPLAAPAGPDDGREPGKRRADALVELARRALDAGDLPISGGERPHVTVEITLDSLEKRLGTPPGELSGTPVPAETARTRAHSRSPQQRPCTRMAGDGWPGRATSGCPSPRRGRVPWRSPIRGQAVPARGGQPAGTDAHHIKHWADGGATSLDNLVLLCRRHHRAVHEGGAILAQPP